MGVGIEAEPAVYDEDVADEVRAQLLSADGVLVWVDPIHQGKTRATLDPMLREVAERGPWVSAHPDVILKMGVKEVLYRTRHLGWGTDTHLYRTAAEFLASVSTAAAIVRASCPQAEPRQWRARRLEGRTDLGSAGETSRCACCMRSAAACPKAAAREFMTRCEPYFGWGGCIIDQPFQPRLPEGMIRCYMGADKVVGFGHQLIKALIPPPPEGPDSPARAARSAHHARAGCRAVPGAPGENGTGMGAADDGGARHRSCARCRSSGTRTSSMARARRRARTATSCVKSMSARASRSPTRRRPLSPGSPRTAAGQPRNSCGVTAKSVASQRDRSDRQAGRPLSVRDLRWAGECIAIQGLPRAAATHCCRAPSPTSTPMKVWCVLRAATA